MSGTRALPPIPRPGGASAVPLRSRRFAHRRRWPAWVTVAVGLLGTAIAMVAWDTVGTHMRTTIALGGFALVIAVGTAMLFIQRVLDVGVARLSGTPLVSSFDIFDKFAFALLLIGSVANGVVVALQIARQ